MNRHIFRRVPVRKRGLLAVLAAAVVASTSLAIAVGGGAASAASAARAGQPPGESAGLGQLSGILPASKLTLPSAIEVNLSKEYVRLPIYPGIAYAGTPRQEKVWYILEDASDSGAADDLGVNYAPKLANMGISCPACVQTVHLINPSPDAEPLRPGPAQLRGRAGLQPHPHRGSRAGRVPAGQVPARRRGRPRVQPVHPDRRIGHRLQRADRRHRKRPVRRGAPHQHLRQGDGHPHRPVPGGLAVRGVPGVVGRLAVHQGLRRQPADRLPVHRRRASR